MDSMDIKLLLCDVDGVLTDGGIYIDSSYNESKRFHVRDGAGIVMWRKCGLPFGIITDRPSKVTTIRAKELGIEYIEQCGAMHKVEALENICIKANVEFDEIAFIGDDLADVPVMTRVGYPIAVADAVAEVREIAKFITPAPGGEGAVRQAIEHLLVAMGRWDETLEAYYI